MSDTRKLKRLLKKICKNPNNPIKDKYHFIYLAILEEYINVAITNDTLPFGVNPEFYHMAPKNKNITFLEFAMVRIGDIKTKKYNPARADAITGDEISSIENIISTGAYCGWKYVPPVINEKGELIAGYHRYEGHLGVWGMDGYIWVAICKFKNEAAEFDYNELENQISLEFEKKLASYEDVLSSTRYGLQRKFYTLEEVPERVSKKRLKEAEKRSIIETIQKENGIEVDLHKTVRRTEVFSEYKAIKNKDLDFAASISMGDTIINNGRLLSAVLLPLAEGKNMNIGLSIKHTPSLKVLNEERERCQQEISMNHAYRICKKVTDAVESGQAAELLTLNFKDQYENDEWKLDVRAENVKN
jgi:hypothetical protein